LTVRDTIQFIVWSPPAYKRSAPMRRECIPAIWPLFTTGKLRMDQILVDAYRATDYVVSDRCNEVVVRIGERSHQVDALLARFGARSGVFITAWNPFSRSLPVDATSTDSVAS
jgi:hypothetical protein